MELDRNNKVAYMTMAEFRALPEYSMSLPTGTTTGKIWKRDSNWNERRRDKRLTTIWKLGQYGEVQGEDILIHWYEVCIDFKVPA